MLSGVIIPESLKEHLSKNRGLRIIMPNVSRADRHVLNYKKVTGRVNGVTAYLAQFIFFNSLRFNQ
jgi:hypothetical protein